MRTKSPMRIPLHLPRRSWGQSITTRCLATVSITNNTKAAGDISSVFPSLSGTKSQPLPSRFAELKARLIRGNEEQLTQSWQRLLESLQGETETIKASGSEIIPEIAFHDLNNVLARTKFGDKLRKRGVALIRGVVSEREALDWKELILRYIRSNSSTKGR